MSGGAPRPVVVACARFVDPGCDPTHLLDALAVHQPGWRVAALWCGDPQLHPRTPGVEWLDALDPLPPEDVERELVTHALPTAAWRRSGRVARALLAGGADDVVLLAGGDVAVLGPLDALAGEADLPARAPATVVPHVVDGSVPDDGCAPTADDLRRAGAFTIGAVAVHGPAGGPWLRAVDDVLDDARDVPLGLAIERVAADTGARVLRDERYGVGVWRWGSDAPVLLDLPGFDPREPHVLAPTMEGVGRIAVVGAPAVRRALAAAAAQLRGPARPLRLPGAVPVGSTILDAVQLALREGERPPPPWSAPTAFRAWLAPRFWTALHRARADLVALFPEPSAADADAFTAWQHRAYVDDTDVPPLVAVVPPSAGGALAPRVGRAASADGWGAGCGSGPGERPDPFAPRTPLRVEPSGRPGVNLVGYLTRHASLGDVARRIWRALDLADVHVAAVATHRTASPSLDDPPAVDDVVRHATTLAVVTADQFPLLARDRPELFAATERMIGYWFWELETVPRPMRDALRLVDEVWVGSTFVRDAFARVTTKPVRLAAVPVLPPEPARRERGDIPELAGVGDRFTFLVLFDHLSVTERKNPVGAIEAFRRAFAPGSGPVLIVKSMNGHVRWRDHQRVLAAAEGHPDIRCVDGGMPRDELMALVAAADCVVSLHRSEGLGLHLAEAMWLGTPTIATRYSGNLDFMDDSCSLLVDADRVPVGDRGMGVYPPSARWAEPDLDAAAGAMRSLAGDPALGARLAAAGLARMRAQPDLAQAGTELARMLAAGVDPPAGAAAGTVGRR